MFRWIKRIFGGLLILFLLVIVGVFISFEFWIYRHKSKLAEGSQIASTSLGDIEYAIHGEGTPRLMIHGTPGGYEQVLISPRLRPEAYQGVQAIGVSRPGYLRTPLTSGSTLEEQADLYAALLDELKIDRVVVLAASGGAPSGLQMAIRHPDRVEALVLTVPMLTPMESEDWQEPSRLGLLMQDISLFLFRKQLALQIIPGIDGNDPAQVQHAKDLLLGNTPAIPRLQGQRNDLEQFSTLDIATWPLEGVTVPTLFLHGNADRNAPYEGSMQASARMPDARLVTLENGDHFVVITRADEINTHIANFLAEVRARN